MSRTVGIVLPTSLPISFSVKEDSVVVKNSSGISLPMRLPASIGGCYKSGGGTSTKSPIKISIKEQAMQINTLSIPVNEQAWQFKGIILEETIVDHMNTGFVIYEDIRSRILTNVSMIDKNHLKVSWYGQEVANVMILRKSALDDKYEVIDTVPWNDGSYILEVSEDSTDIKVEGVGATGESSPIMLEDGFTTEIKTDFDIAINTKVHYLESNRNSVFKLKVNY